MLTSCYILENEFVDAFNRDKKQKQNTHRMTPAFIELVLRNTHLKLEGNVNKPVIGTTNSGWSDIIDHSGGDWPIISAVMNHLLSYTPLPENTNSRSLYQHFLMSFELWLLEAEIQVLLPIIINSKTTNKVAHTSVDKIMIMLNSVARKAANLTNELYEMKEIETRCVKIREELNSAVCQRNISIAEKFYLEMNVSNVMQCSKPPINLTPSRSIIDNNNISYARKYARRNLELLPLCVHSGNDISVLTQFINLLESHPHKKSNTMVISLVTKAVESTMYNLSLKLDDPFHHIDIQLMEKLTYQYRIWNRRYLHRIAEEEKGKHKSVLRVEHISKEVLVVWIAFSLIHKTMKQKIPLIAQYGVSLNWKNIRHFVLSDKEALIASLNVSTYLEQSTVKGKKLFSLKDQSNTLEFAERYASDSIEFQQIWEEEEIAAKSRKEVHWEEVKQKQAEVRRLEKQLGKYELERDRLGVKLSTLCYWTEEDKCEIHTTNSEISRCRLKIDDINRKIHRTKKPPDTVFQPLPQQRSLAMSILFVLHMPPDFQVLSRMSIAAKQMLLPSIQLYKYTSLDEKKLNKIKEIIKDPQPPKDIKHYTSWISYYNQHKPCQSSSYDILKPYSAQSPPKSEHAGPTDVMDFYASHQGIWHPDSLHPIIYWGGGQFELDQRDDCVFFNPFVNIKDEDVIEYFTENITAKVQWTLPQYGDKSSLDRGNKPIALQRVKPDWLKKSQWLVFASVRSFPNQQLRRLCNVLCDRALPLDHPHVHTLIRQTLYHTGDVSETKPITLLWKRDMYEGEFCEIIQTELELLSEELALKPRNHSSILLLIEVANYVSQWQKKCLIVCRGFLQIIKDWIDDINNQLRDANPKDIPTLRAKKGLFFRYALLCYAKSDVNREEASDMCKLIVNAQNESLFQEITQFDEELKTLTIMCQNVMIERIFVLRDEAEKDNYKMLSEAVKLVLHETPPNLVWKPMGCHSYNSACFEAQCDENNLYNINLLNGIVLFNGKPLSSLPATILRHPLYVRSFKDRNFETCMSQNIIKTVMPIKGCMYEFGLQDGNLHVVEKDDRTKVELRLLDSVNLQDKGSWGFELPIILKEKYSHWYCTKENVVLFRDHYFSTRNVEFIMRQETQDVWQCLRVPTHQRRDIWNNFLNNNVELERFDHLVTHSSTTMNILQKFEDVKYIHTFISPKKELIFEYPRFKIEFVTRETDGTCRLESVDYTGYYLSPCQQLSDTLAHFTRYLVLEHTKYGSDEMKIIIPQGDIKKTDNGEIVIDGDDSSIAEWEVYTYDVHSRFKSLQANSIGSRIQLAELYAATGSLLPEDRMQMTGGEVAMQLIRRCWVNQPLTPKDYKKLQNLKELCHTTPALNLLNYEVASSSVQTAHLQPPENMPEILFPADAATEYLQQAYPWNIRASLTEAEEMRVLHQSRRKNTASVENEKCETNSVAKQEDCVKRYEDLLYSLLKYVKKDKEDFPLQGCGVKTKLHAFMMSGLRQSHDAYNKVSNTEVGDGFKGLFKFLQEEITVRRMSIEHALLESISHVPESSGCQVVFRILRTANIIPSLCLQDLLKSAISKGWLEMFNPFLSKECIERIRNNILIWLKLCTLEDKLNRLLRHCDDHQGEGQDQIVQLQVKRELSVYRSWSIEEHPEWLVFEVTAQLQIRPVQYTIARSMIERIEKKGPGPIAQLNMGEGKTRVILPMLIMHWWNTDKLIRLNFLSPLLSEAFDYMHRTLCDSVIGIKFFKMPFNRDVNLTAENTQTMIESMRYCQDSGGIILVAPEHRLSLKLKWYELKEKGADEICRKLDILDNLNYLDILDESDEILRIKTKLIYACGSQESLPSRESRCNVIEALLKVIKDSLLVQEMLSRPMVVQREPGQIELAEMLNEFRILPGDAFEKIRILFVESLVKELYVNPPYELRWVREAKNSLNDIVQYVTNPNKIDFCWERFDIKQRQDILALRGYLANGLFVHCLMKRNRVDYGINRESKRKCMAVPFHACETPALRAEFGHPDCALMYTCLSYYYDGLSEDQVLQVFKTLLSLGENVQIAIYEEWFKLSKPSIVKGFHEKVLDAITKIDLTNSILLALLVQYFKYNIATINFWLNTNVFNIETMQFPHRLEATSWDLATNSKSQVAGFSGTNDDMIIMPSTLEWVEQEDLALIGTDGKMLNLISTNASFQSLQQYDNCNQEIQYDQLQWKIILDLVIQETCIDTSYRTCALIDAGALMAGAHSNEEVATYLADHLDSQKYQAVIYFDMARNEWWVRDKFERAWPKHCSPIHERDGFVYFDESRCRGADMKLYINSRAVLTLGPNMCKDKLMQAAGRMRLLEQGQKILLVSAQDVTTEICHVNGVETPTQVRPLHVLEWVMSNTVQNVAKWLPEWALQGGQYIIKKDIPTLALIPDLATLDDMYGHKLDEQSIPQVWDQHKSSLLIRRKHKSLPSTAQHILDNIDNRIKEYGQEFNNIMGNLEEECERELEKELELEQEVERQIPIRIARDEHCWDVTQLLYCFQPKDIKGAYVKSLAKFVNNHIYFEGKPFKSRPGLHWPPDIHGTENFFNACENKEILNTRSSSNDYLRLIDSFLIFRNGEILLVSEREADKILELTWNNKCPTFVLVNLTYTRKAYKTNTIKFQSPISTFNAAFAVSDNVIAALELFHGEVMYATDNRKKAVETILSAVSGKLLAPVFPAMRGLGFTYARSDLEKFCTSIPTDQK